MAFSDVHTQEDGTAIACTGLTADALPEVSKSVLTENSDTGVSTTNAHLATTLENSHWFALRTTYGRERKAYDYLVAKGVTAFLPTLTTVKRIDGKNKKVEESRLPNIFFAYGTFDEIKSYVYDNVNLPYLRFYYRQYHGTNKKEPLIVPNQQINSLRLICNADAEDIIASSADIQKFAEGQLVRITDGTFKGVVGRVARYQGQQRVAVIIDGCLTIATAYVPSAFIEKI